MDSSCHAQGDIVYRERAESRGVPLYLSTLHQLGLFTGLLNSLLLYKSMKLTDFVTAQSQFVLNHKKGRKGIYASRQRLRHLMMDYNMGERFYITILSLAQLKMEAIGSGYINVRL